MRGFLLKVHIYGGLICSSYLLIFGFSSLNFNHDFGLYGDEKVTWERSMTVVDLEDNLALSESVRDALGLIGWPLPWETSRDARGNFQFGLSRPGKHYLIQVLFEQNRVLVEETRRGFWAVVNSLHGNRGVPASGFMQLWKVYTEVCTWVVLFSAVSGVYLWTRRRKERYIGLVLLGFASGPSLVFMAYVWWRG